MSKLPVKRKARDNLLSDDESDEVENFTICIQIDNKPESAQKLNIKKIGTKSLIKEERLEIEEKIFDLNCDIKTEPQRHIIPDDANLTVTVRTDQNSRMRRASFKKKIPAIKTEPTDENQNWAIEKERIRRTAFERKNFDNLQKHGNRLEQHPIAHPEINRTVKQEDLSFYLDDEEQSKNTDDNLKDISSSIRSERVIIWSKKTNSPPKKRNSYGYQGGRAVSNQDDIATSVPTERLMQRSNTFAQSDKLHQKSVISSYPGVNQSENILRGKIGSDRNYFTILTTTDQLQ